MSFDNVCFLNETPDFVFNSLIQPNLWSGPRPAGLIPWLRQLLTYIL